MLAELHAHTTWSDGVLSSAQLVDLYGRAGFDVLAITDHVVHSGAAEHVRAETFAAYLEELEAEAARARVLYGMLVVPGLELTVEHPDPREAGHALAIGLREFVSVDQGLETALRSARAAGAALIAAHPYPLAQAAASMRGTAWFERIPTARRRWSTGSSSSTGKTASTGSPNGSCRGWQRETSIGPTTCSHGRRSSTASAPRTS
jgi:3',5'-nucleoside bisphosphate phosphatase